MISTQPSVDDLLGRLQDEHVRLSALRRGVIHGVPRPPLVVRLLLVVTVLLIIAVAWLLGVVAVRTTQLTTAIRTQRAADAAAEVALPVGSDLLKPDIFRSALARHPQAAARLHAARGGELLARQQWLAALAAFSQARNHSVTTLPSAMLVDEITALFAAGQTSLARERLLALDLSTCTPADRQRAIALLARQ